MNPLQSIVILLSILALAFAPWVVATALRKDREPVVEDDEEEFFPW